MCLVHQQGATLATTEILGLVEAECRERAERAQEPPLVAPKQAVSIVFDQCYLWRPCERAERFHLTADPGIVNGHDRAGTRGDQRLHLSLIHIEGVGPDVD